MRAGVLVTGRPPAGLEPRYGNYGDMVARLLSVVPWTEECRYYEALDGELPASPEECDAYVITGSAASVYDDLPWIRETGDFCLAAHDHGAKLLGICFGHQLLAQCFGGRVEKSERGWGVGIHEYAVIGTTTWMRPPASSLSVVALHQDQVVEPPPGARTLAGSEFCPYGMMSLGERVFTIQTHPEMNTDYASELFEARKAVYGEAVGDRALRMLDRRHDHALFAAWIAGFLGS
jgi:GMP synthase-like glutamine amidotransferase